MSTNDVGPPQAPVPVPNTAPATAPTTAPAIAPAPATALAPGANPMPFPQGQFPIFVNIPPPLTELTESVPSTAPDVPPTLPSTTVLGTNATTNATMPISHLQFLTEWLGLHQQAWGIFTVNRDVQVKTLRE